MPHTHSAKKALRQSKKRALGNKKVKEKLKLLIKKIKKLIVAQQKELALNLLPKAIQALDKAAQKRVIKKNNAARRKSKLMKMFNKMFQAGA